MLTLPELIVCQSYECSIEQWSVLKALVWFILFMTLLLIIFIFPTRFYYTEMSVNRMQTDAIWQLWAIHLDEVLHEFIVQSFWWKRTNNSSFKVDLLNPFLSLSPGSSPAAGPEAEAEEHESTERRAGDRLSPPRAEGNTAPTSVPEAKPRGRMCQRSSVHKHY